MKIKLCDGHHKKMDSEWKDLEPCQGNAPSSKKAQIKEAEEVATVLRTVCFHIRREWYRRSVKKWMRHFPRPDEAPVATIVPRPAEVVAPVRPSQAPAPATGRPSQELATGGPSQAEAALLLACHGESPGLLDLITEEVHEAEQEVRDAEFILEHDKPELMYIYGYDGAASDMKAWRTLVDEHGYEIIPKEYAFEVVKPPEAGLMVASFTDGSKEPIPGMLHTSLKRGASVAASENPKKRPAAAPAVVPPLLNDVEDIDADLDEGEEEEGADEEVQSDPDFVAPEDEIIDKHCRTKDLAADEFNGQIYTASQVRGDGRILVVPLCPHLGRSLWVNRDKLDVLAKEELIKELKGECVVIHGKGYSIRAQSQGERPTIVSIKDPEGAQVGQVSERKVDNDIGRAFQLACKTMYQIKEQGLPLTKGNFIATRDGLPGAIF